MDSPTPIISLFDLRQIDTGRFEAIHEASARDRNAIFGGQLAAQALRAAATSVEDNRPPHSLHCLFLRRGRPDLPLLLRVEHLHDGTKFSARRVEVSQAGVSLLNALASFQEQTGPEEWSIPLKEESSAEELDEPTFISRYGSALHIRLIPPVQEHGRDDFPLSTKMWIRTRDTLPADPILHACALTYASDIGTGFADMSLPWIRKGGTTVSHTVFYHASLRADHWNLMVLEPLKAHGSRGLYSGQIQDASRRVGLLLMQEFHAYSRTSAG